jgi:glutamate-5-semialdehyde dehydrogenase
MASTAEQSIIKTHKAGASLRAASETQVKKTLLRLAALLEAEKGALLRANKKDVALQSREDPRTDRLLLNEQRIEAIARAVRSISKLPNPSGKVLEKRTLPNGLLLQKWSVPLGVVGAIYESRPNVTFDIAALCLRSRNACVLKGSREAEATNKAALKIIRQALIENEIDPDCVTLLSSDREVVTAMFSATRHLDVLIPRGSESLIQFVRQNSLVPVIETGAGVCHIYVHEEADLKKAVAIVVNAKTSRPSVCNAVDTVLVDATVAPQFLQMLAAPFEAKGVAVLADKAAFKLMGKYPLMEQATPQDFGREFLSLKCALKVVPGIDAALAHISEYSTRHSEAIISRNKTACQRFVQEVDAAAVYTNASTRFTDGEEFGLGAEIGISTQKLHARGPFALEKLVTEKWVIAGNGQIR